ncbi:uncharacterized protein [Periplaneta americana]|uniref:uncharacterized protein isoform X2 n=1 Tax=Periplaneta americana TaxID=6978 RepID=UPI0037E8EF8A
MKTILNARKIMMTYLRSPEETEQRASTPTTEERWTIEPNPLILEPPYVLMDTIELKTNNAEEEPFRAIVSENPPDWVLSILPDTGPLKYVKNGGILITCEPKSYTDSKSRQVQKGRIQVFVADEMKELEVCIKYIPIEIEKWVSAARRPCGRQYVKSNAQQRKFKEKNQQKVQPRKVSDKSQENSSTKTSPTKSLDSFVHEIEKNLDDTSFNHMKTIKNLSPSSSLPAKLGDKLTTNTNKKVDNKTITHSSTVVTKRTFMPTKVNKHIDTPPTETTNKADSTNKEAISPLVTKMNNSIGDHALLNERKTETNERKIKPETGTKSNSLPSVAHNQPDIRNKVYRKEYDKIRISKVKNTEKVNSTLLAENVRVGHSQNTKIKCYQEKDVAKRKSRGSNDSELLTIYRKTIENKGRHLPFSITIRTAGASSDVLSLVQHQKSSEDEANTNIQIRKMRSIENKAKANKPKDTKTNLFLPPIEKNSKKTKIGKK